MKEIHTLRNLNDIREYHNITDESCDNRVLVESFNLSLGEIQGILGTQLPWAQMRNIQNAIIGELLDAKLILADLLYSEDCVKSFINQKNHFFGLLETANSKITADVCEGIIYMTFSRLKEVLIK